MATNGETKALSYGAEASQKDHDTVENTDSTAKRRSISREQRSEAAKRGWVTRKKRKP
jgi:hypothetical protein